MNDKPFSWGRIAHKALKCPERRFNFWWRVASYLYGTDGYLAKGLARYINRRLIFKYGCEIQLGASIGAGLKVTHYHGVVINKCINAGINLRIRQNTTIGIGGGKKPVDGIAKIVIGDNVTIGAGSCIISNNLSIGSNVDIGAMSFINKDIPANSIAFTEKSLKLTTKVK